MFHKKSNKVNFYVLGGFTEFIYKTKLDLFNGSANYNYASLPADFFNRPRKDIRSDLKRFL
jgi:hypothetical protein